MTRYETIGITSKMKDEQLFEWNFPFLNLWVQQEDVCLQSPRFRLLDSSWYITLYPNGHPRFQSKGWIGLFLNRADIGTPKIITYTLQINGTKNIMKFTKTHTFDTGDGTSGDPRLLNNRWIGNFFKSAYEKVKITCLINNCSFISPQETPNSVSCAIRTEIPDSVSCAVQTEVPDGVIDKENSKDEEGSSFDTKEDAILRDRMKDLLIKGSDYDVTICVQDKEFRAHRIILSARSPVFAMMLTHDTKENNGGTINIEDCDPDTFDEFLLYVYSGRTGNLTPSKALQLYYTADKYDFPVLKERCVSLLKTSLSVTSICDVVLLAAKHQEKELLEAASEFFARNMEEILVSVSWQSFMIQNPVEANELYIKSMKILVPRK